MEAKTRRDEAVEKPELGRHHAITERLLYDIKGLLLDTRRKLSKEKIEKIVRSMQFYGSFDNKTSKDLAGAIVSGDVWEEK